jgi:hypothetical protein
VVLRGDGGPGTDADWRRLMQDVETIAFELGKPGLCVSALIDGTLGSIMFVLASAYLNPDPA